MSKKRQYFGTDGIRGRVGNAPITPDFMLKLGWAVGRVLADGVDSKVVVGKDTRISGYMFESALEAGLAAAGADIYLLGPMPTPGVAYLTRKLQANLGIAITASHNLFQDNGIKFFAPDGNKLSDELELKIEEQLSKTIDCAPSDRLGKAVWVDRAGDDYINFCKRALPSGLTLSGLKIVVDCANGATYRLAPQLLRELGAEVLTLAVEPNGLNINDHCGATHLERLCQEVVSAQAAVGIAFDGDGDRLMMVDAAGEILDGDGILFVLAKYLHQHKQLSGGVVGTMMSNFGLELAFRQLGIGFTRTKVGDRYVLAELHKQGWLLGAEPSGHIIHLGFNTTGDGIIAALQVLAVMLKTGQELAALKSGLCCLPQRLINVPVNGNLLFSVDDVICQAVQDAEQQLGNTGRVLLRPSGTEPLIRVMVEGEDSVLVDELAQSLAQLITKLMS